MRPGFAWISSPEPTPPPVQLGRGCFLSRPPLACHARTSAGLSYLLAIAYAPSTQRPRLRIRLTLGRLPLPRNPQASGVAGSSPPFALLIPAFSLVGAPSGPSGPPSPLPTTLPYHDTTAHKSAGVIRGFGRLLEPRYIVGAGALDQ